MSVCGVPSGATRTTSPNSGAVLPKPRFHHFLGESPMAYLAQWRLKLGAEILQSTEDSVAQVALAVGYGSEAAFNRAFKRQFRCPPAQFRRKGKAPATPHPRKSRRRR